MVQFDWERMYGRLEEWLSKGLKPLGETLKSCYTSLESVRDTSQKATLLFNRMTRYRSETQEIILDLKSETKLHSLINNRESGRSGQLQAMESRLNQIDAFLICVNKVLSACKDMRNDVSKFVKMVEIERNIER